MNWSDILALASNDAGITVSLTPLERTLALAVLSSMDVDDYFVFADEGERQEARDTIDSFVARLMEAV